MTAFIFILIYYLGKPVFVSFGVNDRNRFFTALAFGLIFETIVFSITGTTGYKLVGSQIFYKVCRPICGLLDFMVISDIKNRDLQ